MTTLDLLKAGSEAVIDDVTLGAGGGDGEAGGGGGGDGDRATAATLLRLVEMGMTAKARIVVTRRAPLGDPIEVEVRGTRVVLRRREAKHFRVRTT